MKSSSVVPTFRLFALFVALPVGAICILAPALGQQPPQIENQDSTRGVRLSAALKSSDPRLRRRAVQELGMAKSLDDSTLAALIASADNVQWDAFDFVEVLSRYVDKRAPSFKHALEHSSVTASIFLCCAIGSSGTSNPDLLSSLRHLADDSGVDRRLQIAARIGLANLNVSRAENLNAIAKAFGDNKTGGDELLPALLVKMGSWAAVWLEKGITNYLSVSGDRAGLAAVLAASWDENGQFVSPMVSSLEHNQEKLSSHTGDWLLYTVADAKLSKSRTNWITHELVAKLGSDQVGFDHTVASALILSAGALMTSKDVHELTLLLSSKVPEEVVGAAKLLWAIGMRGREAEGQLIKLIQVSDDGNIRTWAAMALGSLASQETVPRLEKIVTGERDDSVKDAIRLCVRLISLMALEKP